MLNLIAKPMDQVIDSYLSVNWDWTNQGRKMTSQILNSYIKNGMPQTKAASIICKQRLNTVIRWAKKNNIKTKLPLFENIGSVKPRNRVFSMYELNIIFSSIEDEAFRDFVKFAFYTGARRGELVGLDICDFTDTYFKVEGKSGPRLVRMNKQALRASKSLKHWNYRAEYISKRFNKELKKARVEGRFHDLRRSFGYHLIKKGLSIYKVSKLLGHASVRTTEKHYAPFRAIDVEDFIL